MSEPCNDPASSTNFYVKEAAARSFVIGVLRGNGVSLRYCSTISEALVLADLRGVDTHGINRIPSYMERIRSGVLDPHATPTLKQTTPVVAQIDGHNSFGFLSASMGIDAASVWRKPMASVWSP